MVKRSRRFCPSWKSRENQSPKVVKRSGFVRGGGDEIEDRREGVDEIKEQHPSHQPPVAAEPRRIPALADHAHRPPHRLEASMKA
jgi:hypothetical protein